MSGATPTLQKQSLSGQPEDILKVCQVIAHCLGAEGWRLELLGSVLERIVPDGRALFSGLSASLPHGDEDRLLQTQQPVIGSDLQLTEKNGEQAYWAALPFLLSQDGAGYLLLFSSRPFEVNQVQKAAESQQYLLSTTIDYILSQQLIRQFQGSMEALHTESTRMAPAQVAVATENARLYQKERQRAEELNTVIELSHLITQHHEIGDILTAAHKAVEDLMPCEAFVIAVNDRRTSEAVVIYVIDKGVRYLPQTTAGATGMTGYVLSTGKTLLIQDIFSQPVPFEILHFGSDESVRSIISSPLKIGDEILGMVSTQSYQPNAFGEKDLNLLVTIANHIAIAIENYNLYADMEDRYSALQEADRSRLELIQNVTHELLTPLTFIKGYVGLMSDGGLGPLNEDQRQGLSIVETKTQALERLVDDLATLEFGRGDWLMIQDVDLVKITRNAIYLARQAAEPKHISITLESDEPFPLVQADPDRMSQVLDNLLSNAMKYGYPNSTITVRMQAEQAVAKVAIFNQGDPIAVADQVRLFQRFFRADRSRKGSGLGLPIVKHIVEAHGGRVWVESQEGVGNTFIFTIPISQKNIPEKDSEPGSST